MKRFGFWKTQIEFSEVRDCSVPSVLLWHREQSVGNECGSLSVLEDPLLQVLLDHVIQFWGGGRGGLFGCGLGRSQRNQIALQAAQTPEGWPNEDYDYS